MPYQFSASPLYVEEGQSIQFRYEAPPLFNDITQVKIEIGELTVFWIIETKLEDFEPDPFFLRNVDDAEPDTLLTYAATTDPDNGVAYTGLASDPDPLREGEEVITITGLDPGTQAPLIVSSNVIDVNNWSYRLRLYNEGSSSYGAWGAWTRALNNTVSNLDQIQVRLVSSSSPSDTKNVVVTVGTGSATWDVTTGAIPVNTPNPAPDFGSLNNLPLGQLVYSDIAQILGLTTSAIISVDNGAEIAVSNFNTTFTNADGYEVLNNISNGWGNNLTVSNGQYVQLRGTSSATPTATINFSVTVGDGAGISVWQITSGQGIDDNPTNFVFQDLVGQIPGQTGLRSETASGSSTSVAGRNVALVGGLDAGLFVPVTVRPADTNIVPKISINGGSSGLINNVTVQNGDTIELVVDNSTDITNPVIPGQGVVTVGINVGNRFIQTWTVANWTGPDTIPAFTPINQVINRTPGGASIIGPIGLTDFNLPITISATNPESFNEFNFATNENIGDVLFSINGDSATVGPRTVNPDPGGDPVFITIIMQQPGNADLDPVQGLSNYGQTVITFGDASPFQLRSINYAVKPIPPAYLGVWYSEKNAYFDDTSWAAAGEDPNNARDYYRAPKFDGYSIGTVVPITKETPLNDGNFGYGDIEERYPGFLPCDGATFAAADYPWLWEAIGNTYGGNGAYIPATKSYTGNFNVPDYRNVRMVGAGIVDSNRGSSSFVPVTSAGGSFELTGSTGGYWYVDDVDVAGPDPLEQVVAPAGSSDGIESEYFTLGTPRTFGTEELEADVEFTVTGEVVANIGPVSDVSVRPPQHEHEVISGQIDSDDGDPLIPWGTRAYYGTSASGSQNWSGRPDSDTDAVDDGYWEDAGFWNFGQFNSEVENSGRGSLLDLLPGVGSSSVAFGNYWGSPFSEISGLSDDYFTKNGNPNNGDCGVIDTTETRARIDNYLSIYTGTLNHSHLLGTDPVTNPQTDFSYGNVNSDATAFRQGLATFNSIFALKFTQNASTDGGSGVDIELNPATFSWNNTSKPIPTAAMNPQRKVPIIAPFHKVKYIIKAY
ncbi:short tail fiber protein [Prochlorococcus phage Syn1]|uniref:Short tail fiber n=1 Tax=Prochlorococcus phage Syn1 TaxID=444861 RepID=E3SPC3_9CAUD|nr:short tail fiber protein [Prochlorococcus phage Syn1]ADO99139.1 short tail fiber [Prochlorococcus phage Syn1]